MSALDLVTQAGSWNDAAALCRAIATHDGGEPFRIAVTARDRKTLIAALSAQLADGGLARAAGATRPKLAFVCSGQGSQWLGMGRSLLVQEPVFRAQIEACDERIRALAGWSLVDELLADEERSRTAEVEVLQLVLFSVQVGIGALWRSWGIEPDAIVGTSLGEAAAFHLAGVLTLEEAMRVVFERTRLARELAVGRGELTVVTVDEDADLAPIFDGIVGLGVGGYNSPRSIVLSGTVDALVVAEARCAERGLNFHRIKDSWASHSPQMEPLLAPLSAALRGLAPRAAKVALRSTALDAWVEGPECGADYWARNLRNPVHFRQAIEALAADGPTVFVELSAHPVLLKSIEQTLQAIGAPAPALPSCWRGDDERSSMLETLAALHRLGFAPRWPAALPALPVVGAAAEQLLAEVPSAAPPTVMPFTLSAKCEPGLRSQAARLRAHLEEHPELPLSDVAYSLAATRAQLERRAVVVAGDRGALGEALDAVAAGRTSPRAALGEASGAGKLVFVFPGQGPQWAAMAQGLLASSEVFRERIEACAHALSPHLDWSLLAVLRGEPGAPPLERIDVVHPVLFSMMVSLAALWRSVGVEPDAVVGHSLGEIAAACVAGALSLEDAARLVAVRSRALTKLVGRGAMASVELSTLELTPRLEPFGERLSVGAINGPRSTMVSGEPEAIDSLVQALEADGVFARKVRVDVASHCAQMELLREDLLRDAATLRPRATTLPMYSTVTGEPIDGAELGADYWYRNGRQTVRFAAAIDRLVADGARFFVEVSAHPVLTLAVQNNLEACATPAHVVGSLRRDHGDWERFVLSVAELHAHGRSVDWTRLAPKGRRVALPTYPFQRQRHWLEGGGAASGDVAGAGLAAADHPLLGAALPLAEGDGFVLTGRLSLTSHPWLAHHAAFDTVLLSGSAFVELALAAAQRVGLEHIEELTLEAPLLLPEEGAIQLQVALGAEGDAGGRTLTVYSRPSGSADEAPWTRHASGRVGRTPAGPAVELRTWPPPAATPIAIDDLYARLAGAGVDYGSSFRGLKAVWKRGAELFAEVELPDASEAARFGLHPALLDAAMHAVAAATNLEVALPFAYAGVSLVAPGATALRVQLSPPDDQGSRPWCLPTATARPSPASRRSACGLLRATRFARPV